jgi:Ca2+-binding RTX toxin-like protein
MKFNAPQSIAKAVFETLEGRECLSATIGLHDGVLTVKADANTAANIKVQLSADHRYVTASVNGVQQTVRLGNDLKSLILVGSTQDDYIYVDPLLHLPAQIAGDAGNDTIWGGGGVDSVDTGDGNDLVHAGGTITTGHGNNTVWATGAHDTIYAGTGTNLIVGGLGNDVIYGSSGHDTILAGGGTDKIVAGTSDTVVYGSTGHDTIVGGTGHDTIYGGAGDNAIVVSSAQTIVHAQPANTVYKRMNKRPGTHLGSSNGSTGSISTGSSNTTGSSKPTGSTSTPSTAPRPVPPVPPSPPVTAVPPAPPVPPAAPVPTAPTAVLTQLETSIIAGEGVNVNALASTIHNGTALTTRYQWDFGDAGSAYNDLTGWNAGHVYGNPGTYTITLTMTDSAGLTSAATGQVTVAADTRPTIYVDTHASDNNTGASTAQAVQTAARAVQLAGNTGNVRILFKRGETFNINATLQLNGSHMYLGAYGTGANPVLNRVAGYEDYVFLCGANSIGTTFQGLTFDSPNAVASGPAPEISASAILAWGTDVVVRNNTFLNLENALDGELQPHGMIVQDNTAPLIKGLRGYFCWVDGTDWSILGNTVANSTRQHDIRANDPAVVGLLIEGNNLTKQYPADDPAETYKTTINVRAGNYVYVSGNVLNHSTLAFNIGPGMTTQQDINWVVVEDNYFNDCPLQIKTTVHDVMVRDNYIDFSGQSEIYLISGDLTDPYGHLTDITIEDNTGVNRGTLGTFLELDGQAAAGTITLSGNLYVAPQEIFGASGYNSAVMVNAPDLSGFASISNNIWPAPLTATINGQGAVGVVNYLAGSGTPTGFVTPAQWDAAWPVHNDQFSSSALPAGTYQMTVNGVTAGAAGLVLPA